jgi:hypothetical protein
LGVAIILVLAGGRKKKKRRQRQSNVTPKIKNINVRQYDFFTKRIFLTENKEQLYLCN